MSTKKFVLDTMVHIQRDRRAGRPHSSIILYNPSRKGLAKLLYFLTHIGYSTHMIGENPVNIITKWGK